MPTDDPVFPDLHPDAFVHDEDRAALQVLRDVPGLDLVLRSVSGSTVERTVDAALRRSSVRLGPTQYRTLYRMVERAARCLDLPVPDAWLVGGSEVNASAFGFHRYSIRLYQGLVDVLDDAEIQAVIGHEMGHIACEHMLYKSLGDVLSNLGGAVLGRLLGPPAELVTSGVELALRRWSRAAEYSCDRAALLVSGDPLVVAATLVRLGGTSRRLHGELDLAAALAQTDESEQTGHGVDLLLGGWSRLLNTHPEPILRAKAILAWADSSVYAELRAGRYLRRSAVQLRLRRPRIEGMVECAACGSMIPEQRNRCPNCGCHRAESRQWACTQGHVNDRAWFACQGCGELRPGEG